MNIAEHVAAALQRSLVDEIHTNQVFSDNTKELENAEKLADLFSEVRPQTYIVPIQRYVGLPIMGESKLATSRVR